MRKDRHIHKKTCKYRLVTCHKGCNTQYKWKDRASHNCVEALKDELKGSYIYIYICGMLFVNEMCILYKDIILFFLSLNTDPIDRSKRDPHFIDKQT